MQTSDTSALLATTALSNVAHWLCIIICKAFWKRFVPPQAEVWRSQNDTLSRNSKQGHQAARTACHLQQGNMLGGSMEPTVCLLSGQVAKVLTDPEEFSGASGRLVSS